MVLFTSASCLHLLTVIVRHLQVGHRQVPRSSCGVIASCMFGPAHRIKVLCEKLKIIDMRKNPIYYDSRLTARKKVKWYVQVCVVPDAKSRKEYDEQVILEIHIYDVTIDKR